MFYSSARRIRCAALYIRSRAISRFQPGIWSVLAVLAIGWAGLPVHADILYTDRGAFEAGLPAGYFSDNFSSATDAISAPSFSYFAAGGTPAVGYSLTAPAGGLFIAELPGVNDGTKFIGPWEDTDDLLITFNSNNVRRAGIEIFLEDFDSRVARDVTINFSTGTSTILSVPASGDYGFIGIFSDTPLTSMTIVASGGGVFTNTTRMLTATPEPSSACLLALCLSGMLVRRRAS